MANPTTTTPATSGHKPRLSPDAAFAASVRVIERN